MTESFINNIINIYGEAGKDWLKNLPDFLKNCEQQWDLALAPCYSNLSFNYVAPAKLADGTKVALKCGVPNPEFYTEIAALQQINGVGAVKLIKADASAGKMLLENIAPGFSLEIFNHTPKAIAISVDVMSQLHKKIDAHEPFPTLAKWFQGFDRLHQIFLSSTGPFPPHLIDRAEQISKELLMSMGEQVLLHGDLHYGNILFSEERGWLAIDPKGLIGEAEYEIPLPKLDEAPTRKQLEGNLHHFIEITGFDKQRILGWLFAKAVLAAWWSYEDGGKINQHFIACAEIVKSIKL